MTPNDFDQLIEHYAQSIAPTLPASFASDVLRETRLRQANRAERSGRFSEISSVFFHPGMLAAGLMLALSIGIALPTSLRGADRFSASESLGLHVFTSATLNLPSGLLAQMP